MDYFVLGADGKEYGPCDFETLAEWAKDDRLRPESPVREAETGRSYTAVQIPGLFVPAVAPQIMPQQPTQDSRYLEFAQRNVATTAFTWALIDSAMGLIMFAIYSVFALLFCGLSIVNALRAKRLNHPMGNWALIISLVCFGIVLTGWILRGMNG